jgi:hypothetical protein
LSVYSLEWAKLKEEIDRQEVEVHALREKCGTHVDKLSKDRLA